MEPTNDTPRIPSPRGPSRLDLVPQVLQEGYVFMVCPCGSWSDYVWMPSPGMVIYCPSCT